MQPDAERTAARRVAVTGVGVVSAIGSGVAAFWRGALAGRSAVRRLTRFDAAPFRSRVAAEVDQALNDPPGSRRARRLDRYSRLALAAGHQALADAGLGELPGHLRDGAGVYVGSALGGVAHAEAQHRAFLADGARAVDLALALSVFGGAAAGNLAIELGLHGPCLANANSCASGAVAIGEAYLAIRSGRADLLLAGGAEAPLAPLTFGSFDLIRALSTRNDDPERASRPFDRERDGFVMAEGAAFLVLEAWELARERSARIYAELVGYAATSDGHHMAHPRPDGAQARRCMALALHDAGVVPAEVGLVSAHASATPLGDRAEAQALMGLFDGHRPCVFATKGAHGHALGATPAMETALLALALARGCAPPTTNLGSPDEGIDLAFTGASPVPVASRYGLKTAFGFGGLNACLVLAGVG